jgi:hypothetical protein
VSGWALLTLAVLSLTGCGDGKTPLNPVEGQVFFDKKPAHRAVIRLHPLTRAEAATRRPFARVEKDGSFRLGTYRAGDGVAAGKYRVTVSWNKATTAGDVEGESLLPARYQDPEQSGLPVVEIKEGANQLPPFYLSR